MPEVRVVDPYAPEALNAPGEFYDRLRERCPVARVDDPRRHFWIVSGYANVVSVMNDHAQWTKIDGPLLEKTDHNVALSQDPPSFTEFRATYANYMSPKGVQRWADDMRRFANELIDALPAAGQGDFHDLFAMPLAIKVMARMLGLPLTDVELYKTWSDNFMKGSFNSPEEAAAAIQTLYDFFDTQYAVRREALQAAGVTEPGPEHVGTVLSDDLISVLMTARFQGRRLTDEELRRTTRGFFIGGNETTTSLILNVLVRLHEAPERWRRVCADPALIEAVIEESLRLDPPAIGMFRGAACPVEVDGVTIPEGDRALYSIPSANRDPAVFSRPTEFLIDRPAAERRKHLAFSYGSHFCPGAWLSRLESRIALELIVTRLPKLRLLGPGERIEPFNFWGRKRLPAAWN